jgi:hypothetical protein
MERRPTDLRSILTPFALVALTACTSGATRFSYSDDVSDASTEASTDTSVDARDAVSADVTPDARQYPDIAPIGRDVPVDMALAPDAACTAASVGATLTRLPVDIVWAVDNSVSMSPAIDQVIAGLNAFASLVGTRGLDYRVVMLSLRNVTRRVTLAGSARYAVCIPRPLAGDDACGNGPRFFHSSVDIRSTQPLEQLLGTLGQTRGYTAADPRGGEAWRAFLRPEATKTIVVVTDDQSRLTPDDFERFRGGTNPNSSGFSLPPGLLDASWGGAFTGYTFNAIYGWGSETDPGARCTFADGTQPPASGTTYTTLIERTRGVRARICDGAAAWAPFFERVATAVERASRVACDLDIPTPPAGQVLDPRRINVAIVGASTTVRLGNIRGASACGATGGWYYDDEAAPRRVILCPSSCERAQAEVRAGSASVQVQFGCQTIPG